MKFDSSMITLLLEQKSYDSFIKVKQDYNVENNVLTLW